MTPGARFFTRGRLLTNVGRVAAAALWLALFLALLYLTPIVPRGVLSVSHPNKTGGRAYLFAFNPDGKMLVTADDVLSEQSLSDSPVPLGPVVVWDVETLRKRFTLVENAWDLDTVEFSPDGKLVCGKLENWSCKIRDCASGRLRAEFMREENSNSYPYTRRFTPDGRCLVIEHKSTDDLRLLRFDLWDIESQQPRATEGAIENIVFSRDGKEMIVVYKETSNGQVPTVRWVGPNRIRGIWTKAASSFAKAMPKEVKSGERVFIYPANSLEKAKAIAPDLKTLVYLDETSDGGCPPQLVLADLTTGRTKQSRILLAKSEGHVGGQPWFSPAGKFVVLPVWHRRDVDDGWGTPVLRVDRFLARPDTLASDPIFSWNDQWILARDDDEPGATLYETGRMTRHGDLCVSGDAVPKVTTWGNAFGPAWLTKDPPKSLFAPDNKTVVLRGLVRTRQPNPMLAWLTNLFGTKTAPAQSGEVARLWDVETCTELACFDDCIQALYSPDGKTLATAHTDGKVRLWDVPPRKPMPAILGTSLVLWLSVLVAMRLWVRGTKGGQAKL